VTEQIPLIDVKAQYAPFVPELEARFSAVLESGRLIFGPEVEAFEREAAAFLGVPHAIGVANGTDALVLALEALGIGRGDEVICPSFTFYATAEAIARVGATPVFADIDPTTLNLDPEDVAARIALRTKAIVPVHLFGRPAALAELSTLGLPLIEDAAQAFGAEGVAQAGICSTYSFFPTKNLFALGDGGLVTSLDEEVAERVRMLRFHGSRDKKTFELIGTNSRLDAVQAAMLRVFLPHLTGWNEARRAARSRPVAFNAPHTAAMLLRNIDLEPLQRLLADVFAGLDLSRLDFAHAPDQSLPALLTALLTAQEPERTREARRTPRAEVQQQGARWAVQRRDRRARAARATALRAGV